MFEGKPTTRHHDALSLALLWMGPGSIDGPGPRGGRLWLPDMVVPRRPQPIVRLPCKGLFSGR
jgi:hypothetical protein